MSDYSIGDYVLLRAKVIAVHGSDIGYSVELFSKTDQYAAMVRPDLVVCKTDPPPRPEPDREYLVKDARGEVWRWSVRQSAWECVRVPEAFLDWEMLAKAHGPLTIYGDIS